jgi:hypothetical protein
MRSIILLLSLSLHCALCANSDKKTFHALIACDTNTNLKESLNNDIVHLKETLRLIAHETGLSLKSKTLTGEDLNRTNLLQWLKSLPHSSQDVVFFYFSGHGFRTEDVKSPWPYLFFISKSEIMPSSQISRFLKKVNSRLTIVLYDCCNGAPAVIPYESAHGQVKNAPLPIRSFPGLKPLFLETKGMIIASGSSPGQNAYAFKQGGLFTTAFLYSLCTSSNTSNVSWKAILAKSEGLCSKWQKPIFSLKIKEHTEKK